MGSSVWITHGRSDYDFIVICREAEQIEQFRRYESGFVDYLYDLYRYRKVCTPLDVNHRQYVLESRVGHRLKSALLLTPDEYVGGGQKFVRELRLDIVRVLSSVAPEEQRKIWVKVEEYFNEYIKNWKGSTWRKHRGERRSRQSERSRRFINGILVERYQRRAGDDWHTKFAQAMDAIKVPDFETYARAIEATKGALTLGEEKRFNVPRS
ncbi:MAG: hypothetical protein AB1352_00200 [Patescibacteria group bacterium]